ncbi:MAG TPA: Gfo/Idh/MocA family oxidoreductase [Candidatus Limnocylindria bacterium]|nr:Gfo/Idh/MocA family oxidoreductase [Candidatus Limnocylindria bacterium]
MKHVAIIGAGLQAKRRLGPILESNDFKVVAVVDRNEKKATALAAPIGAKASTDWRPVVIDPDVSLVLVLTYPDTHAAISAAALEAGKDVLCEKPLTRTIEEARALVDVAKTTGRVLKCGFNHRHHPAVLEAHKIVASGEIGKPVFGRGRYGIGARVGVEKEWRSDPNVVSGGQLMEQGIHLVDLFRWLVGDVERVTGFTSTTRWPITPLEDNGFALMQMKGGAICSVHASLTQWTNLFEMEVYGEKGSVTVEGLGGSYGVETLRVAMHDPTGPFSHRTMEFRGGDSSWKSEWDEFTRAIAEKRAPLGSGEDGLRAMEIVNAVYSASKTGHTVVLS